MTEIFSTLHKYIYIFSNFFIASPAFSWIDDYVDFLPSNSRKCCQFNEKNGSVCYSEDYVLNTPTCKAPTITDWDWDYPDYNEDIDDVNNPKINQNGPDIETKKSKATHDLWLPGMLTTLFRNSGREVKLIVY